MIISGMSDMHGYLSHNAPECNVLAIVGDFVPLYSSAEDWKSNQEKDWIEHKFIKWLKKQPFDKCFIVPGNHDMCLYDPMTDRDTRIILESIPDVHVLISESYRYEDVNFYGHPWTPSIQNRNWAFSQQRTSPASKLASENIPDNTDVLLTHGPPQGLMDGLSNGDHVGCASLMMRMLEVGPRITMTGHIHTQRGKSTKWFDQYGNINKIINVSICDEGYSPKGAKVQTIGYP